MYFPFDVAWTEVEGSPISRILRRDSSVNDNSVNRLDLNVSRRVSFFLGFSIPFEVIDLLFVSRSIAEQFCFSFLLGYPFFFLKAAREVRLYSMSKHGMNHRLVLFKIPQRVK